MTGERGSVTVVAVALVGFMALLAVALGGMGQVVAAQGKAQAAADAAALAAAPVTFRPFGATGSAYDEARSFAEANGARLVECRGCRVDRSWNRRIVEVTVRVDIEILGVGRSQVAAVSAAEFVPVQLLPPP
jgi:secretion/DNA translocation related TadE-like protein